MSYGIFERPRFAPKSATASASEKEQSKKKFRVNVLFGICFAVTIGFLAYASSANQNKQVTTGIGKSENSHSMQMNTKFATGEATPDEEKNKAENRSFLKATKETTTSLHSTSHLSESHSKEKELALESQKNKFLSKLKDVLFGSRQSSTVTSSLKQNSYDIDSNKGKGLLKGQKANLEEGKEEKVEADGNNFVSHRFLVSNIYGSHEFYNTPYPHIQGKKLFEPYRETTLKIVDPAENHVYRWTIAGNSYEGDTIESKILMKEVGDSTIQIEEYANDGTTLVATSSHDVVTKYIRREIHTLTDEDVELFFKSARVMWDTSEDEGIKLYGNDYHSLKWFLRFHLREAGAFVCDHIHEGLGFLTQHSAFSIVFEKSLQAIEPSLSLPYWDYTIEAEYIKNNLGSRYAAEWYKQPIWSEKYFGAVDETLHTVTEGRWAFTKIDVATDDLEIQNSYGLLRAPWNSNGFPYVTRATTFCGSEYDASALPFTSCESHYDMIQDYSTWQDFAWTLQSTPHGPIHVISGGTLFCDGMYDEIQKTFNFDEVLMGYLKIFSFYALKNLYRNSLLTCPKSCSEDTPQSECLCSCPNLLEEYKAGNIQGYIDDILIAPSAHSELEQLYNLTDEDKYKFLDMLCNAGILVGDHLESASPADISFWPLHPTIERLYQFKVLTNTFSDTTWNDTEKTSWAGNDCYGHHSYDLIHLENVLPSQDYSTNLDVLHAINPLNKDTELTYIYDNFDWNHCSEIGYDFSTLLSNS